MSAIANSQLSRAIRFYDATVGKKAVMAVTGVILFGYIVAHMLGNLQIYAGPGQINAYGKLLHSNPGPLWVARAFLLAALGLHIWSSLQLWLVKRRARPIAYTKKDDIAATYASRTMLWSGPIIAAFVIFHILHLTTGDVLQLQEGDIYNNVISGFLHPAVSVFYIFAVSLLGMHLYHGIWSMFQSLGIDHPRYTAKLRWCAGLFAILIVIGYISIPVSVLAGWLHPMEGINATRL